MDINLELGHEDPKFIRKIKKRLLISFDNTKLPQFMEAIEIANYMFALQRYDEARKILLSIVHTDSTNSFEELSDWNGFGITLLAVIARKTGDRSDSEHYLGLLRDNAWLPNDRIAYVQKVLKNQPKTIRMVEAADLSNSEERIHMCEYLCDEVLELRYFHELFWHVESPSWLTKRRLVKLPFALDQSSVMLQNILID